MTSNRESLLRQRTGIRGALGLAGAAATVCLTTGIALAYSGSLPLNTVQGERGGSSQGSLGSSGPPEGPTTPPSTTEPTTTTTTTTTATTPNPTVELPAPAANEFPVVPRQADVTAVEQGCHITVYYGPLAVGQGSGYVITVGPDRSVLGPTEVGTAEDGTHAYRLTDPVDYRERSLDRTYFAMEISIGEDGNQQPLGAPEYHYLGNVPAPEDGACTTEGREIPIIDASR